jgi:hypothetical protein
MPRPTPSLPATALNPRKMTFSSTGGDQQLEKHHEANPSGSTLSFEHLSYRVEVKGSKGKFLVDDVSVTVKSGELLAIMVGVVLFLERSGTHGWSRARAHRVQVPASLHSHYVPVRTNCFRRQKHPSRSYGVQKNANGWQYCTWPDLYEFLACLTFFQGQFKRKCSNCTRDAKDIDLRRTRRCVARRFDRPRKRLVRTAATVSSFLTF